MEIKLNDPPRFPVGTTVKAYLQSGWPQSKLPPAGAPLGASAAEAVVAANGDIFLTGLAASTPYFATAQVGGNYRYLAFVTGPAKGESLWTPVQRARYEKVAGQQPRETMPVEDMTGNVTLVSGQMLLRQLPVQPGDVLTKLGFLVAAKAVFGTTPHWWTALYAADGSALLAKTADQTNAPIAESAVVNPALTAPYKVPDGVYSLLAGIMVNAGAGGTMPTIKGKTLTAVIAGAGLFAGARHAADTSGEALGAEPPAGPLALVSAGFLPYLGAA